MNVYRFNQYTKRYYKYNISDYSADHPMFNCEIHNNDITPNTLHRQTCGYCMTTFSSRTQLFNHLGFMNIDIGGRKGINQYHEEMGDFGIGGNIPNFRVKKRRYKSNKRYRYKWRMMKRRRERPRAPINLLAYMMDSVRLT